MKRQLLAALMWLAMTTIALAQEQMVASAYIFDNSGSPTNVRNAPSGTVVHTLPDVDGGYVVTLLEAKDNWWRIDPLVDIYGSDIDDDYTLLEGSTTGYWVHNSVLAVGIAGEQENVLRESPSEDAEPLNLDVGYLLDTGLRPVDITEGWIKVITADKRHSAWMPIDRICSNPLTTCP